LCPCCGYKLRRPRNFSKIKLREKSAIEETQRIKILCYPYSV
jgi:hypothetical protein